mmetsp:Transcript_25258/g.37986  ORF Transcript_25258/g.37986 Transcript_25258/m.37986 type:complete len:106 (+) Transcript_25258:407-724(+)
MLAARAHVRLVRTCDIQIGSKVSVRVRRSSTGTNPLGSLHDLPHNASCSMRYSVAERIMPSEHAQLLPPGVSTGVREARAEGGGANVTGTAHPPPPFAPLRPPPL